MEDRETPPQKPLVLDLVVKDFGLIAVMKVMGPSAVPSAERVAVASTIIFTPG